MSYCTITKLCNWHYCTINYNTSKRHHTCLWCVNLPSHCSVNSPFSFHSPHAALYINLLCIAGKAIDGILDQEALHLEGTATQPLPTWPYNSYRAIMTERSVHVKGMQTT
jgi:hypothetical protein